MKAYLINRRKRISNEMSVKAAAMQAWRVDPDGTRGIRMIVVGE